MHGAPGRGASEPIGSRHDPQDPVRPSATRSGIRPRAREIAHMTKRPVIIYGANGFSGRLIAEFLREYNTPFIAAGRSWARIKDVMDHVPGIETADFEIVETAGSLEDLPALRRCQGRLQCGGSIHLQRTTSH